MINKTKKQKKGKKRIILQKNTIILQKKYNNITKKE